jgi:hypothetical protein
MEKTEVKKAMPHLIDQWVKTSGNEKTSPNKLVDGEFISWLRENHPEYLKFRTTTGVIYDIENWFDQYVKEKIRFMNIQLASRGKPE